jgi:hypothetical protein
MPALVIPNTFLVTLLWNRVDGVMPRNVLGIGSSGSEVQVANTVSGALTNAMFNGMTSDYVCPFVSVLPLDGTTASIQNTTAIGCHGAASPGDQVPSTAVVVSLKTANRGPRNRGRVYLGPITEGSQSNGMLGSTEQAAAQTAWNTFLTTIAAASPSCQLVVVSRKHSTAQTVTQAIVERTLGTQRRRQTQLR